MEQLMTKANLPTKCSKTALSDCDNFILKWDILSFGGQNVLIKNLIKNFIDSKSNALNY